MTIELTHRQVIHMPTAALKLIQNDLRSKLVPEAMQRCQELQRSLVWVDRELKQRKRGG